MTFQYCPDCGSKLIKKEIGDEGMVPFCETCNKPLFDLFPTCIIALVVNEEGEAALLEQGYLSTQYRTLVSGYMKPGESAEETAVREIEEEIGLKTETLEFAKTFWFARKQMLMIGFFAHVKKQELRLSCEVDRAQWVPLKEALGLVNPNGSISYALVEQYINENL